MHFPPRHKMAAGLTERVVEQRPFTCMICGAREAGAEIRAREMMYGTRAEFTYLECAQCRSVQISEIPADLAQHYPANYYSYASNGKASFKRLKQTLRDKLILFGPEPLSQWLADGKFDARMPILRKAGLRPEHRVLDIGCGGGDLLRALALIGVRDLQGADPHIAEDVVTSEGVRLHKRTIAEVEGAFDLIMFHHSLEHVDDPAADLRAARERLASGGTCLVRIPLVGGWAWRTYGADWYGLDAPRHLAVPSVEGMRALAARAGFTVEDVVFDSGPMQFTASELYKRDIPLTELDRTRPSPAELEAYKKRAVELNAAADGDQAAFILKAGPAQ